MKLNRREMLAASAAALALPSLATKALAEEPKELFLLDLTRNIQGKCSTSSLIRHVPYQDNPYRDPLHFLVRSFGQQLAHIEVTKALEAFGWNHYWLHVVTERGERVLAQISNDPCFEMVCELKLGDGDYGFVDRQSLDDPVRPPSPWRPAVGVEQILICDVDEPSTFPYVASLDIQVISKQTYHRLKGSPEEAMQECLGEQHVSWYYPQIGKKVLFRNLY